VIPVEDVSFITMTRIMGTIGMFMWQCGPGVGCWA